MLRWPRVLLPSCAHWLLTNSDDSLLTGGHVRPLATREGLEACREHSPDPQPDVQATRTGLLARRTRHLLFKALHVRSRGSAVGLPAPTGRLHLHSLPLTPMTARQW